MRKILFFSHYPTESGIDGANKILMTTAAGLNPQKYDKIVVSPGGGVMSQYLAQANIKEKIFKYNCYGFDRNICNPEDKSEIESVCSHMETVLSRSILYNFFKEWKPSIVYANTIGGMWAAVLGKMVGAKVLWHIHEIVDNFLDTEDRRILNRIISYYADKIVVVSKAVKRALREVGQMDNCELVYNGVQDPGYTLEELNQKRIAIRQHIGLRENTPLFAYLGQIAPVKGVDQMIMAADLLLKVTPQARFVIIGDPARDIEYTKHLKKIIHKLGREKEIKFGGYCKNLSSTLPAIDCLVVPSVYEDPLPTVLIEANLYRKPIVAFKSGGVDEVVIHGKNGFLVEKRDVKGLAKNMYMLANNPDMARSMGDWGYRRAFHKFEYKRYIQNMEEILDEVVNGIYGSNYCRNGNIVKGSGPEVYLISDGQKRHFLSEFVLDNWGFHFNDVVSVKDGDLSGIPEGPPIEK